MATSRPRSEPPFRCSPDRTPVDPPLSRSRLAQSALLDVTSITNIGLLGGALWVSARKPPEAKPLTARVWIVGLAAGFAMGYSSRLAFGCNVGAMFSGISTGSVHGWIWMPMAYLGTLIGLRVRRRIGF